MRTNAFLFLAGIESSPNVDPTLTPASHAIPCGQFIPTYGNEPIDRIVKENSLDAAKKIIGRETIDFNPVVELDGSGVVGTPPLFGPLLEGCGMKKSVLAAAAIDDPIAGFDNTGLSGLVVAKGGTFTGDRVRVYKVKVTTGGESLVAKVSVECWEDSDQNSVENTVTTGTPINLGDEGATITFTFAAGSLVVDDCWYIYCYPAGVRYRPNAASDSEQRLFFYYYLDGMLYKGGASVGNFDLTAEAGKIASLNFTFQSVLNSIADASLPSHTFSGVVPPIVQQADLRVDGDKTLLVEQIQVSTNNDIVLRPDVNGVGGIHSYKSTERDNAFAIDPEAKTEAEFAFWDRLRNSREFPITFRIGSTAGRMCFVLLRRAVIDDMGQQDKNMVLVNGLTGQCRPSPLKNDNIEFFFC